MFLSRLWIKLSRSTSNVIYPCFFVSCLFVQHCILPLCENIEKDFSNNSFLHRQFSILLRSIFNQPSSTIDCNKERTEGKKHACFQKLISTLLIRCTCVCSMLISSPHNLNLCSDFVHASCGKLAARALSGLKTLGYAIKHCCSFFKHYF